MTSPTVELQTAIVARVKNDAALSALIDGRIYDQVPYLAIYFKASPNGAFADTCAR